MTRTITHEVSDDWGGSRKGTGPKIKPYEGIKYIRFSCTIPQFLVLEMYLATMRDTVVNPILKQPRNSKTRRLGLKCTYEEAVKLKAYLETIK